MKTNYHIFKFLNWLFVAVLTFNFTTLQTFNCFAQANRLWATYYGGSTVEENYITATDALGNVYLAGRTFSNSNIATAGSFKDTYGSGGDAFLVKFDSNGNRIWGTYYGGSVSSSYQEYGTGVATDALGNVYLAGITTSSISIATAGGFQTTHAGGISDWDAFLVKFDSDGNRIWATYYGGVDPGAGGESWVPSVATDASRNVYLGGTTTSTVSIATAGSHQDTYGGGAQDAFLVKFDENGNRLWATYYGGTDYDWGYSVATDASQNVYLSGNTWSTSGIATAGGFCNTACGAAYLVKFDSNGNRLWGTYYGGAGNAGNGTRFNTATDASSNVYLAGTTITSTSTVVATAGSHQPTYGGGKDALLVKFDAAGNRLWATYYGGTGDDYGGAVTTDASENVYLAGGTTGTSGIAFGGFQNTHGGGTSDNFLVKFDSNGNRLCATYYGGTGSEGDRSFSFDLLGSIATDGTGNVYLAGHTSSATGIATTGGFQTTPGNMYWDDFLVKFDPSCTPTVPIELLSFTAEPYQSNSVLCNWSTATEINNDYFGLEKSTDGINFSNFANVKGAGNSSATIYYQYIDDDPYTGISYYRLKQTDYDGKFTYSPIRAVYIGTINLISIYPNPASDFIQYEVGSEEGGDVTVKLYDALGREVFSKEETISAGLFKERIEMQNFASGNYLLRITNGNQEKTQKQFVVK